MDNQLIQFPSRTQKLLIVVIVSAIAIAIGILGIYWFQDPDPYIQEVLALEGDIVHGHDIFQINCSGCHSSQISRSVGPNLTNIAKRKSKRKIIQQVISGQTPPMPKFQPSSQEMADLLKYLEEFE